MFLTPLNKDLRGTFVSKPKLDQGPCELTGFSQEMRRHRMTASSRVIDRRVVNAGDRVANALQLRADDPVFVLQRPRVADYEPMGIPAKAGETCFAVAEERAAALLGIPCGALVFEVERVTFLASGRPVEFVQSNMRGDRYSVIDPRSVSS